MRCATCGTENAPDSRFCGGCGAKLAPSSRVAPTAKIPDDASYPNHGPGSIPPQNYSPPPQGYASGPASIPPQNAGPASIPPQNAALASRPPQSYVPSSIPPQNSYQAARAPTPMQTPPPGSLSRLPTPVPGSLPTPMPGSLSFAPTPREGDPLPTSQRPPIATPSPDASFVAPPQRPVGLMVAVLIIDLALAGSGAFLLAKGLAKQPAKPVQKSQVDRAPMQPASAELESLAPAQNVEARASNVERSSGANVAAPARSSTTAPPPTSKSAASKSAVTALQPGAPQSAAPVPQAKAPQPAAPVPQPAAPAPQPATPAPEANKAPEDPYAEVSFDTELDRHTASSKAAFDRCAADAGAPRGTVRIAFRVLEDGTVANAFVVEDSTGTAALGQCLAQTITTWRFTPHTGAPINSLRAFNYP